MATLFHHSALPARRSPRQVAAISALAISLAAAAALSLFSTEQAVGGGWLGKAAIPARMALLVLGATLFLRWAGVAWRDVGLRRPDSAWRTAALVVAGYVGVGLMFALATQLLLPSIGAAPKTLAMFVGIQGNTGEYLYWLLPVAWGSAAFGEELLFRAFLQSRIETALGGARGATVAALLLQALIFGALHSYQGLGGAVLSGLTGLVLGIVYLAARRNLWAPIILHGLVDTVTLTAVYLGVASTLA
jgi:membrane protease YdiL (CAAX protease family)